MAQRANSPERAPTIHDVARLAGVATSTVSRALAGEPRVSAATRERVRQVAHDLGYRPSRSAQSLRSAKTGTIGLLSPNLENPIAYDHLRATVRAAFDLGYTIFAADCQDSAEIQDSELARMSEYRVDGLILGRGNHRVTGTLLEVLSSRVPVEPRLNTDDLRSAMGSLATPYPERAALDGTAATIGYRRLLELGHRRFALFTFSPGSRHLGQARTDALDEVLRDAGVGSEAVVTVSAGDPGECVAEVQYLAALRERPTAFISAMGRLTPYILEGIHSAGLRIPTDASFLCFGDSQWHKGYSPPISVIRHDYAAAARRTVERLVARIEGREVPEISHRPSEFVMRGSIGPAPIGKRMVGAGAGSLK